MLENQKNVALFSTVRTQARENLFQWAGPISVANIGLYKLKSRKDIQYETYEELKRYRFGGTRKDFKSQYFINKGFQVDLVAEERQNIFKLFADRIDILPYGSLRLRHDLKKWDFDPNKLELLIHVEDISREMYIAFNISSDAHLVEKFQKGFAAIRKNGMQEKIQMKWEHGD